LECEIQRSEIELIRLGIEKINKWIAERWKFRLGYIRLGYGGIL
jgi:hypothetical protein